MIVPPNLWFHQHFNTGTSPARYLAFKAEGVAIRNAQGVPKAWISRRLGGDQIDYADESPRIRQWFQDALAKRGLESRMEKAYEAELAELQYRSGATNETTGPFLFIALLAAGCGPRRRPKMRRPSRSLPPTTAPIASND